MTIWAKDCQIRNIIIAAITIKVRDFQHVTNTEATMSTNRRIGIKGKFTIIEMFGHFLYSQAPEEGSHLTPELTRAEHKASNVREQFNDESHAIEASG
jgi:hypothetical protein